MRVLEIADMYLPNLGGTELHIQTLSRWMASEGHDVAVATLAREGLPTRDTDPHGIDIFRLRGWSGALNRRYSDSTQTYHPTSPDPGIRKRLVQLIDEWSPDVVHAHGWISNSLIGLSGPGRPGTDRNGKRRAVTLNTLHDNSPHCVRKILTTPAGLECPGRSAKNCLACAAGTYGLVKGAINTLGIFQFGHVQAGLDQTIAVSSFVKTRNDPYVTSTGAAPIEVIPSFVHHDIVALAESRSLGRLNFFPNTPYALYVGVVSEHKGIATLLDAWRNHYPGIDLVLIGPDRRAKKQDFPPGVTFVGPLPHDVVLAAWAHATIGVVPSIRPDSFPTVTTEAMSFGVPVVASQIGGLTDQISNGFNGLLVSPGSSAELGRAVQRLVDDLELYDHIRRNGRVTSREFAIDRVGPRVIECFNRVRHRVHGAIVSVE